MTYTIELIRRNETHALHIEDTTVFEEYHIQILSNLKKTEGKDYIWYQGQDITFRVDYESEDEMCEFRVYSSSVIFNKWLPNSAIRQILSKLDTLVE